jgi:hypothetical protein
LYKFGEMSDVKNIGRLRGAKPLFLFSSPSPLKERGIKGVR